MDEQDVDSDTMETNQDFSSDQVDNPVTTEELAKLTETEMLFHSNFIRLEIDEILKHCSVSQKLDDRIGEFLRGLYKEITEIPESSNCLVNKASWFNSAVKFPFPIDVSDTNSDISWHSPDDIKVVGSYLLKTMLKDSVNVDVLLVMPKECLSETDFQNHRYFYKRAVYLAHVAYHLSINSNNRLVQFSYFLDNPLKPTIIVSAADNSFTVRLHACPPSKLFHDYNFYPNKGNVTEGSVFLDSVKVTNESNYPTPHYNNAILLDLKMDYILTFLHKLTKECQSFKDAVRLLKLWLHHRQFDQGYGSFSGFLMSMYVALLLYKNKINSNMSSYQIVRNVFTSLASSNWMEEGASFEPVKNMETFYEHFEVVFLDPSGKLNLCANMSSLMYRQVVGEAKISFEKMDKKESEIYTVFMNPLSFLFKFDCILHFSNVAVWKNSCESPEMQCKLIDHGGNCIAAALPKLCSVLSKGLGNRVESISIKPHRFAPWNINTSPPKWMHIDGAISIGLIFNLTNYDELLIKGPSADLPEAADFRNFWGELSELRRFKDGSICEAVYFDCENEAEKRNISLNICYHLLEKHCLIPRSAIAAVSSSFDIMLRQVDGTMGDEMCFAVRSAFHELTQQLTSLKSLPLAITNVFGLSPSIRGTEAFPPHKHRNKLDGNAIRCGEVLLENPMPDRDCPEFTPAIEVICFFESSGKWPKEAGAIQRVKAAFNGAICNQLRIIGLLAYATPTHVYIFKDHCLFKLEIGYHGEKNVLETYLSKTGLLKSDANSQSLAWEKNVVHRPRLATQLESLSVAHPAFGTTCRLARRWFASHMLLNHFSDEAVDLLCAFVFLEQSHPPPRSAQTGFLRFLHLISTFDFKSNPLIVDFKQTMSANQLDSITAYVKSHVDILPPLCILTSLHKRRSMWTEEGPEKVVIRRMHELAGTSLKFLKERLLSGKENLDVQYVFMPRMAAFDVIIFLKSDSLPKRPVSCNELRIVQGESVIPAVMFDPAKIYLQSLEESFGDYALFFYDRYNKDSIGVAWKPAAFQQGTFKVMSLACKKLEKGKLIPNLDAIVEDFRVMGMGLVESIEWRKAHETNKIN